MGMVGLAHLFASWRPFSGHHHRPSLDYVFVYAVSLSSLSPYPSSSLFVPSRSRHTDLSFVRKVHERASFCFFANRARRGAVLLPPPAFRFRNYTRFADVTRYTASSSSFLPLSIYLRALDATKERTLSQRMSRHVSRYVYSSFAGEEYVTVSRLRCDIGALPVD